MLLVAEMLGHLRLHRSRLGELLQQPVFANDVFGLSIVRQQFADEFEVDSRRFSLV